LIRVLVAASTSPGHPPRDEGDPALVARMARGDGEALGTLYDRHAPYLLAVAVRMLGATREAQDLLHDVFLEAWERSREYDVTRGTARTWLLVRLRSRALDRMGRAEVVRVRSVDDASLEIRDWTARRAAGTEAVDGLAVRQALGKMPQDVRHVLELTYFDGLTGPEVATRLGAPLGTVKSRLARGLALLADLLVDAEDQSEGDDDR
jgi:RNA polymerase sigma-70 factor (ECF subfamily)